MDEREVAWDGAYNFAGTPLYLRPFLEVKPERVAAVMTALAGLPEGGVLLHCQAGRDRTGIVSLVLLDLLDGFDAEAYLLSGGTAAGDVDALRRRLVG